MLLIDQLTVELAGIEVLRHIHAHVLTGSTVAVIGRNGAGKTTLLRSIMGLVPVKSGQLLFDQTELLHTAAHRRASLGIGYAPEDRVIFPTLSVLDNLRLPAEVLGLTAAETQLRLDATRTHAGALRCGFVRWPRKNGCTGSRLDGRHALGVAG